MKIRHICALLALLMALVCVSGSAEALYEAVRVDFEDGFSLTVPADWVSFEANGEALEHGILYVLGSADGARQMYVQQWDTQYETLSQLEEALRERDDLQLLNPESIGSNAFLMYGFTDRDCTGCLTVHSGTVLNLMFAPQSDAEFMAIVATIMDSCRWIEVDE